MTTVTWTSTAFDGDFFDANNWSPTRVPVAGDFAYVTGGLPLVQGATIDGFTLDIVPPRGNTSTFHISNGTFGPNMVVEDTGSVSGASLNVSGQSVNQGTILLNATVGGVFNGFAINFASNSDTLTNTGTISIGASDGLFVGNGSGGVLVNNGVIDVAATRVFLNSSITGTGTISAQHVNLDVTSKYATTLSFAFADAASTITFENRFAVGTGGNYGTIDNFVAGDTIFFNRDNYVSGSGGFNPATRTVTVGTNNGTFTFQLNGTANYAGTISVNQTGNGFGLTTSVACFATGTRIATADGPRAVEDLAVGDRVVTVAGAPRDIVWIGQRRIACRHHPDPASVWPVRIRAGAFGPGSPSRDLRLSPDHGVLVDGRLVPAGSLVDGEEVTQERVDDVTYWHVELDAHDVLFAECLPCESYLDTGNRAVFANAAPVARAA